MMGDEANLIEIGTEPEFAVSRIVKTEAAGYGMVRIYWASERGKTLRLEYTQIVPAAALPHLAQALLFDPPKPPDDPVFEVRPH